jgi:hypothetical protein
MVLASGGCFALQEQPWKKLLAARNADPLDGAARKMVPFGAKQCSRVSRNVGSRVTFQLDILPEDVERLLEFSLRSRRSRVLCHHLACI